MRLLRLRLAGFGPFRGEQCIDFTRFQEDGLFLIAGRTGAGKSSILDAVAYALYDSAPRYEGAAVRGVRSDHAAFEDPSFAELEFELGDERFRVRREPEFQRPKRRGEGMTSSPARAQLERRRPDGEWIGIASGPRDVGLELAELLPLQRAQFLQVVLLAQNEFMRFLDADSEERRRVLRALFRTERFERIAGLAVERRRLAAERLERERARLGRLADELAEIEARTGGSGRGGAEEAPVSERLEQCRGVVEAAAAQAESALRDARDRSRRAETEAQRLRSIEERQRRRAEHERRSAELQAREERIGALRERLAEARRLLPLRPQLVGLERLAEELDRAARGLGAAVGALEQPLPGASGTEDPVAALDRAALDQDADEIGRLRPLVEQERSLPGLRERHERARQERERLRGELQTARQDAAALPELRAGLLERRAANAAVLAEAERIDRELAEAERAVEHAERAERLRPRLEAARLETARAARRRAQAAAEQAALLHARIEQAAGELGTRLHPGEPCPVCGSTEHPDPAPAPERAVDAAAIAAAEERFRSADETAERAQTAQRELEERLGEQLRLAGPLDAEGRERALAAAHDAVRALRAAQTERERIETELAGAARRADELSERLRRLEKRSAEAAETAAALEHRRRELEHRVREARGEDPDAAARLERLERRRAEREAVLSARDEHERVRLRAASAAAETERALRGAMPEACPPGELTVPPGAAWRELLARLRGDSLSEAELEADQERVTAHEHALAAVSEQLRAPELLGLPREPVDAEAAERLWHEAREAVDEALREQIRCQELQDRLQSCTERIERVARRRAELEQRYELVRGLADALEGGRGNTRRMGLEAFVLAAELEDIVRAANARLGPMTSGRYTIEHDDSAQRRGVRSGLGLRVLDAYTGRSRSTRSLSGGETFLASLSLALGLADAVTSRAGGVRLETMFVDEGFGTLDADTLGVAMAALDSLRSGGRTVGVISHVEAMQEQIPAKLRVRVTERGDSVVEQD